MSAVAIDTESAVVEAAPRRLLIGGEWRDASGGRTLGVEDPSTGEVLAEVADATPDDAMAALDAAVAAQERWAAHPPRERGEILRRALEAMLARAEDLALLMTLQMGSRWPSPGLRWSMRLSSCAGSRSRLCGSRVASQPCPTARAG